MGSMGSKGERGVSLVEILVALCIVGLAIAPLLGLFRSGRATSESNLEKLQAVYLAQKALEQVRREAEVRFDTLVSVPAAAPLVAERIEDICYYFRRVDVFGHNLGNRFVFPELAGKLKDFSCSVEIRPWEGLKNCKLVVVTIYFSRKALGGRPGSYTLETLISKRDLY